VYTALDYGLDSETERRLSDDLERLFEVMTAAGEFNYYNMSPFTM
jgi:hypothetical protein